MSSEKRSIDVVNNIKKYAEERLAVANENVKKLAEIKYNAVKGNMDFNAGKVQPFIEFLPDRLNFDTLRLVDSEGKSNTVVDTNKEVLLVVADLFLVDVTGSIK